MILGIIPARGGSQMKDKNTRPINGRPMIEYTIEAATNSRLADWFVFTDKYLEYRTYGIKRLTKHSQGEYNSVINWLPYAVGEYEHLFGEVDSVCLLQPTSPMRTSGDIDKALDFFEGKDSLVSGYYMRIKSDDVDHKTKRLHFQRNGAIFIFKKSMIPTGKLWNEDTVKYEMPKSRSIEVDTEEDFLMAEVLMKELKCYMY